MRFHHLGIATEDIDQEIKKWKEIFSESWKEVSIKRCFDSLQGVELCLFEFGNLRVEIFQVKKLKIF